MSNGTLSKTWCVRESAVTRQRQRLARGDEVEPVEHRPFVVREPQPLDAHDRPVVVRVEGPARSPGTPEALTT